MQEIVTPARRLFLARSEQWLADPEALIPGQRMGYRLADAAARADVIAYLATLPTSNNAATRGGVLPRR